MPLTKAEKSHYRIGMLDNGCWYGMCPHCGELYEATDVSMSQLAVVAAIKYHELIKHKEC